MEISLPWFKYRQPQQQLGFYQRMFEGIARNGQAQTAAIVSHLPLTGANSAAPLEIEGRPLASGDQPVANWRIISPDYFKAMGIRLIQGRTFSEHDNSEAPKVVIINETMARRFWPGLDPIEKHMRLQGDQTPISVVGIVNDVRHWGLDSDTRPEMYFPFLQEPTPMFYLVMRTDSAPTAAAGSVRREISAIDPDQPVTSVKTMESLLANSVGRRRFSTLLLTIFAGLALALAAVGTSAMMAYSVAQRRHEIGIRMALGARRGDIMRLVLRQGLVLCLIGLVLGFVPAIALRGLIETSLFGVTSTDPATVAGIPIILIIAALVASYLPARRAAGVEPMTTLRVG
jgi:putative ABC transport system permease protein